MPFNIGPLELIIILVIALLILGPGKLPEVGASLGKSIREFRKAASDISEATSVDVSTPQPNTMATQAGQPQVGAPPQIAAPQPLATPAAAPSEAVVPSVSPNAPPTPNVISDQAVPNEIAPETKV